MTVLAIVKWRTMRVLQSFLVMPERLGHKKMQRMVKLMEHPEIATDWFRQQLRSKGGIQKVSL